jgi:hypothetical protein
MSKYLTIPFPRILVILFIPPQPGNIPNVTSGSPIFAFLVEILISVLRANSRPPPSAPPLIADNVTPGISFDSIH